MSLVPELQDRADEGVLGRMSMDFDTKLESSATRVKIHIFASVSIMPHYKNECYGDDLAYCADAPFVLRQTACKLGRSGRFEIYFQWI